MNTELCRYMKLKKKNSCVVPCARIFNHEIIALVLEYDPDRTPIHNKNTNKYEY